MSQSPSQVVKTKGFLTLDTARALVLGVLVVDIDKGRAFATPTNEVVRHGDGASDGGD